MQSTKEMKHVTNRNGAQLAELARQYGVSREDFTSFLKDKKRTDKFFGELNTDNWFENIKAEAEKIGACVHLIPKLTVDYSKKHNECAMAGGPQTGSDYNVLKVADKYQPSEDKKTDEVIVLLNYPKGGSSYEKAVQFGLKQGLRLTTPHVPFAVGENFPKLNYELGPNPMYVAETTGCVFNGGADACYVWWHGAERRSNLNWQGSFGDDYDWFAFRK